MLLFRLLSVVPSVMIELLCNLRTTYNREGKYVTLPHTYYLQQRKFSFLEYISSLLEPILGSDGCLIFSPFFQMIFILLNSMLFPNLNCWLFFLRLFSQCLLISAQLSFPFGHSFSSLFHPSTAVLNYKKLAKLKAELLQRLSFHICVLCFFLNS